MDAVRGTTGSLLHGKRCRESGEKAGNSPHSYGTKMLQIIVRSLIAPSEPNDRTYKELVDALQEHHDPTPSETVQRFLFNSRVRQPGSPFQHMCLNCEHYRTTLQLRFFTRRYVARLPSVWYS